MSQDQSVKGTFSCSGFKARRVLVPPKICSVYISHRSGNNSAAPTAALARMHSCRPRRGGLLSAWTCTPAQRLPGDSEGEEPNKRERESAEKERGRGRGRKFGCGKMPSAHSLTQPRPAFRRLRTCKSVIRLTGVTQCSQEQEHVLRLLRALLSTIAVTQQQFTSLHFLLLLACLQIASRPALVPQLCRITQSQWEQSLGWLA